MPPQNFVSKPLVLKEAFVVLNIIDEGEDALEIIDALLLLFKVVANLLLLVFIHVLALVLLCNLTHTRLVQTHQSLLEKNLGLFFVEFSVVERNSHQVEGVAN